MKSLEKVNKDAMFFCPSQETDADVHLDIYRDAEADANKAVIRYHGMFQDP